MEFLWTILGAILGVGLTIVWTRYHERIKVRAWVYERCLSDGLTIDANIYVMVVNDSKKTIPALTVHIMDHAGLNLVLECFEDERAELKSGQTAAYKLSVVDNDGNLTQDSKWIMQSDKDKLSMRIFQKNTIHGQVFESRQLGHEILMKITELVGRDLRKRSLLNRLSDDQKARILEEIKNGG
jgi:hypothetical protein